MATYQTFGLTSDGDLDFTSSTINLVDDEYAVRNQMRVYFNLVQGDWFLDLDEGIDYLGEVFGKKQVDNQMIDEFKTTALDCVGVTSLKELEVDLYTDRNLAVTVKAYTEFSELDENVQIEIV